MTKLTPKQERFCLKYIELGNASEAYRQSYDTGRTKPETIHRNAHSLLENTKVTTRVTELQAKHQKRHEVTVDSLTTELDEFRLMAITEKHTAAGIAAVMGKAKLHGKLVDRIGDPEGKALPAATITVYIPKNERD